MIWLLWMMLTLPLRAALGAVALVWRTVRFVGPSRIVAFGVGVGTGMMLEPSRGRQLRAKLATARPGEPPASPTDLGAAVRDELAHSPRTWHLPQPVVAVAGNRVTLTGEVPHDEARLDLGRVAGAVAGVSAVDNQITVSGAPSVEQR